MPSSRLPGFYNLPLPERLEKIAQASHLSVDELTALQSAGLSVEQAQSMVENSVGIFSLPLGIALNFIVNGREVLIPMAIEEPSVIAGASYMAKLARLGGGFQAEVSDPLMIGQVQVLELADLEAARKAILDHKPQLLEAVDAVDPVIKQLGGGARDLEVHLFQDTPIGPFLVVHLIYDVRDAMGANAVNTACEKLAPLLEKVAGGRVHLRILSNLADRRLARASCIIPVSELAFDGFSGEQVRNGILEAWAFAASDPYRAATHNKGIMNGIDAVVIATGNDWRAVEAGAHAYAARGGTYTSLSTWSVDSSGNLCGSLEMPMAVGIVGGATRVHPAAKASLKLLGVRSAAELSGIIVSVGLAQNLAALRALSTEGIQRGHMSLHARQVAIAAGAVGEQIEKVAALLVSGGEVRLDIALKLIDTLKGENT